jgi:hypothetical protein
VNLMAEDSDFEMVDSMASLLADESVDFLVHA